MLIGEYQHNIDAKGRLIMPSKLRDDLGEKFIVTRGLDGCLFGYPLASWEVLVAKLGQLPVGKSDSRKLVRTFFSAATECEIDKQGRINIPASLVSYAKLEKECIVVGVQDRIEIWSGDTWAQYSLDAEESFDEIAESMFDFGL